MDGLIDRHGRSPCICNGLAINIQLRWRISSRTRLLSSLAPSGLWRNHNILWSQDDSPANPATVPSGECRNHADHASVYAMFSHRKMPSRPVTTPTGYCPEHYMRALDAMRRALG